MLDVPGRVTILNRTSCTVTLEHEQAFDAPSGTARISFTRGDHMLHHLSIPVASVERSAAFYDAALAALGYVRVWSDPDAIGYGYRGGDDKLAIKQLSETISVPGPGFHIAFTAESTEAVDAFHAAALRHGGTDYGKPGPRPHYGPRYYAAFVLDPDGYRLEAVITPPE